MSLLYSSSFKYQEEGLVRKNQEFTDSNHHHYNQEENQHNSGLMRYRSAPSSVLDSLVNSSTTSNGNECGDFRNFRPSSPEMDTILSRFISACNGSGDSNSQNMENYGEKPAMKQEMADSEALYRSFAVNESGGNGNSVNVNNNSMDCNFSVMNSMAMENSLQSRKVNGSNLVKQHSSPAGFFSNLGVDNGFTITKEASGFRVSNGMNEESNLPSTRLGHNLNFSSGQRLLPQIAEIGDEIPGSSSSDQGNSLGKRQYMNFEHDLWDNSSSVDFKRLRDNDGHAFSSSNIFENQNGNSGNRTTSLTHHLSLPKTAGEMATVEKYLQFQGSVPCKIRAKRGFATHPRSIAERVRRTRISDRMRKLQDLFPKMDKQTSTADMLDLAVGYIKDLQKQVKTLADTKSKCTCSSTQKLYAAA
ncbi:transcription factor bHLH130-like isoform X2 [Mercurialis annua]|uniref:transcription factor bHLH130-like isoform X2 n=1 Tax=Mercurialis annua TaxID=3986 RepID=UPI002160FE63|nr:transcription factor bHLH130-like isoform X2 [Mercurialis annua]